MFLLDLEKEKLLTSSCSIFPRFLPLYRHRSAQIAKFIIKEDGTLNLENTLHLKDFFLNSTKLEGLDEQDQHIFEILKKILEDSLFQKKILSFDLPITPDFEKFARLSLNLSDVEVFHKAHLRRACVGALFAYLRQTVGSCFATAPCLYILKRHPDYFLEDLFLLSKKNCLERISGGKSVTVPMALSMGEHFLETTVTSEFLYDSVYRDFKKQIDPDQALILGKTIKGSLGEKSALELYARAYDPILKIWEYTVASFCDAKGEFSESTLYLTLGLDAKMPEGLGEFFYNVFQKKLDEKHLLLVEAQNEAYLAHQRLVMAEGLAKNASSEASFQRAKSEIIAANYQLHSRQLDIDDVKKEQTKIQNLYDTKIAILKEAISHFFQESYDPDLVNMKSYQEDSPAGFRLFIKDNQLSSRFKPIQSEDDFVKALKQFFEKIENDLLSTTYDKENHSVINNVITETIQFSSSKGFLEKTYLRAKKRHPKALPWAYVSGGTLETLLKTYFRKEILKIQKISGDTLNQLLIQLIDYFKSIPEKLLEPFRKNPYLSLLLETKNHACLLQPGLPFFKTLWDSSGFTYTDVRDKILNAGRSFYNFQTLSRIIPEEFFQNQGKNLRSSSIENFLKTHPSPKEALFLTTSFLIKEIAQDKREQTCGYCRLGDTNWNYSALIIGYNPLNDQLALFAQDPESCGLLILENMMNYPVEWKIYEDLARSEIFIPGIKI